MMRSSNSALQTALYTTSGVGLVQLLTIYLPSGTVRYADGPSNVSYGGTTWTGAVLGMQKGKAFAKSGTSIDSLELTLFGSVTIGGASLVSAAAAETLQHVRITYARAYYATPGGSVTYVVTFCDGTAERIVVTTESVQVEIKDKLATAKTKRGTRICTVGCPFSVNDVDCAVSVLSTAATAASGSTVSRVYFASFPTNYAVPGSTITFTSGVLSGVSAGVRAIGSTYADLTGPVPSAPAVGVTMTVTRGCDKSRDTCRNVYANIARCGSCADMPATDLLP